MPEPIEIIINFVEGRMTGKEFEQQVYNNAQIEELLKDESLTWFDTYIKTNPYDFLIWLDYDDPGGVLNAQGAMELFLERKGIENKPSKEQSRLYDALLDAQPKWLSVRSNYLKTLIADLDTTDLPGLKHALKEKLLSLFRYNKKPPKWIQSPDWPIGDNGPLYFLGQIKLAGCELFHDEAAAYLFIDTATGTTETVIQVF